MKGNALTKTIDVLITLLICVLLIVALVWFVHTFNVFKLPAFIENIFVSDNVGDDKRDAFEENLLALMESQQYVSGEYQFVSLTNDKAIQLLSSITPVSDFFWEVETSFSYENDLRKQLHRIYKRGEQIRIDTIEDGEDLTTVFSDSTVITVNNVTGGMSTFSGDTDFVYDSIINIAALEYALSSDTVNDIAIVESEGKKYIYAEIPKKDIDGVDKYFVSLDYGLILSATSYIEGIEYFSQQTLSFDTESVISDKAFEITDSKTTEPLTLQ